MSTPAPPARLVYRPYPLFNEEQIMRDTVIEELGELSFPRLKAFMLKVINDLQPADEDEEQVFGQQLTALAEVLVNWASVAELANYQAIAAKLPA